MTSTPHSARTGGLLLQQKWEDLALYLHQNVLPHLPKVYRFTLGARIDALLWEAHADIIRMTYNTGNRLPQLAALDLHKEVLLAQLRMATRLKTIPDRRYDYIADLVLEVGRIIGGLKKRNSAASVDRGTAR